MAVVWRYESAVLTALVAAVFSLVVCALLVVDFGRRMEKDPLDSPPYLALREQADAQRDSEPLRTQIRALDLQLRENYFRQRWFTMTGAWLLLGGLLVTLVAVKSAVAMRPKLPHPVVETEQQDTEGQVTRHGRWAVAVLGALLVAGVFALHSSHRSFLPVGAELVDGDRQGGGTDTTGSAGTQVDPTVPPPPTADDFPSPEELRQNWHRFRGPGGAGVSAYDDIPTQWNGATGDGIVWKSEVPLPGNNSPIVWQQRVFTCGATKDRREVYCFDADSGALVWKQEVNGTPQSPKKDPPPKVSEQTGYAAPTMTTDGRRVYAMFANGDVAAFDLAGNAVWSHSLGIPQNAYGHASSLAMYRDLLIVQFDQGSVKDEKSRLLALSASSGETVWSVSRAVPNSWTSPIVINQQGKPQIVTNADPWVIAYAPSDGAEIWRAKCLKQDVGPSPAYANGVVFVANEFPCLSAIRADGQGDVTDTHVLWTSDIGLPDTCSPLVTGAVAEVAKLSADTVAESIESPTDQLLLLMASYGTLTCFDAATGGEPLWEEDFDGSFSSSPSLAGNRVYLFAEEGKAWIVEPNRQQCRRIAEADLGEPCVTSPAFQAGRIYIRGEDHLFCIGNE